MTGTLPVPDFRTPRLALRRLRMQDAAGLHLAYGDAEAMRFWDSPPAASLAETEARIAQSVAADPQWHAAWAVLRRTDASFIGMVNYHGRAPWHRRLAVGWMLVPAHAGQGYAQEAMHALLQHCFTTLDTHRIEAEIEPDNHRSERLAHRLGFRREGLLRERMQVAGSPRSIWMFGLLRPEYTHSDHA